MRRENFDGAVNLQYETALQCNARTVWLVHLYSAYYYYYYYITYFMAETVTVVFFDGGEFSSDKNHVYNDILYHYLGTSF